MDKQKQIEEMAKYCCNPCEMSWGHDDGNCSEKGQDGYKNCALAKETAEKIYNKGYRKIPEGAVVLTREEYEKQKGFSREEVDEISKTAIKNSRKETAEKFAEMADKRIAQCQGERDGYEAFTIDDKAKYDGDIVSLALFEIAKEIMEGK